MTWYVAITNPNCHRRAETELSALGYRAFWPKMRKWVNHARVKTAKEYPILGRYMFVEVPAGGSFWTLRNVNGIEALLTGDRGEPAEVSTEAVMRFMCRYHAGEWDSVTNSAIPMGARVRVLKGEFRNMLVVIRGTRNGKVRFLPPGRREMATIKEQHVWAA